MKNIIKVGTSSLVIMLVFMPFFTSEVFFLKLENIFTVSAWVTKGEIRAGEIITADLLTKVRIKPKRIYGSIQSHDKLVGQTLTVHKQAGSTIYLNEVMRISGIE